jgi:citrate lyase subunit beta/citryl-CoA lyase
MLAWLSQCVAAAKAAGLAILDGTYNQYGDEAGLRTECEQGRAFGMDGKTLIHPDQVPVANEVFAPNSEEIAWARMVVDVFARPENHTRAAVGINGHMYDRLHEQQARRLIDLDMAIRERAIALGAL